MKSNIEYLLLTILAIILKDLLWYDLLLYVIHSTQELPLTLNPLLLTPVHSDIEVPPLDLVSLQVCHISILTMG